MGYAQLLSSLTTNIFIKRDRELYIKSNIVEFNSIYAIKKIVNAEWFLDKQKYRVYASLSLLLDMLWKDSRLLHSRCASQGHRAIKPPHR